MLNKSNIPIESEGDKLLLFSGKIIRKSGALAFYGPIAQFFLTVEMGKAVWLQKVGEHEEVCIGVKAKNVRIADQSSNDAVCFSGDVEKNSIEGPAKSINIKIGEDWINVPSESALGFNGGEAVLLQFSRADATLFRCMPDSINQTPGPLVLSPVSNPQASYFSVRIA